LMLAWATIGISLVWLIQRTSIGAMESLLVFEIRLPGLASPLGGTERWQGPFESPNYAGPAASFALIFSFSQRGGNRAALLAFSTALLVASGSRSSLLGAVVGSLTYFALRDERVNTSASRRRIISAAVLLVSVLVLVFRSDPTLNGRTQIWPQYLDWWLGSPWSGVGTSSISRAVSSGEIPGSFIHAHNAWIDILARYGSAVFLLVFALTILALFMGVRATSYHQALPLALIVTFLMISLVEVHGNWTYWSSPTAWLLVAVLSTAQRKVKSWVRR
jgi:O-antigen ligase